MNEEIKYCKFCGKEKPIKEFVKSGFAIKNICRECQNKKQAQIYGDSKKVKELEKENQELKKQLEVGKEQYNDLVEEKEELQEQLSNSHQIKTQQKEFIEYLESEIKRLEENNIYEPLQRTALATFQHVLSIYKEIIGVKEWDKD